jgi:hypothetical protein
MHSPRPSPGGSVSLLFFKIVFKMCLFSFGWIFFFILYITYCSTSRQLWVLYKFIFSNYMFIVFFFNLSESNASHDLSSTHCSPFETPKHVSLLSFLLVFSHHHPLMNIYHISLLLLVVFSAYSEGPQHAKPPEPLVSSLATVCPKYSHISFGFFWHTATHTCGIMDIHR